MARSRATDEEQEERSGAGGKIVKRRRRAAARIPYARPVPPEVDARVTPSNWLTGVVFPKIVTGAAKLLSSLVIEDSSSSSSSSGSDDSPADGSDDENMYNIHYDGVDRLYKKTRSASEFDGRMWKESSLTIRKNENKHLIRTLIMQETFSREECDSLVSMIKSRTNDGLTIRKGLDTRSDIPNFCNKAIIEAKQWLEKKKDLSNSKLPPDHGIWATKSGLDSPVDVAKSYMRDRPPWKSPSINSAGEKTPSPMDGELQRDEALYGSSFSSLKRKMYSLSSGSWNIQDEIRRVRSKATEDMLKSLPLQRHDLSSFALESEGIRNALMSDRLELVQRERLQDVNLFPPGKSIDASSELAAAGVSTSVWLPDAKTGISIEASAADTAQDGFGTEDLKLQPSTVALEQGAEDIQMVEEEKLVTSGAHPSAIAEPAFEHDSRSSDRSCPVTDGGMELTSKANNNGVAFPGHSLPAKGVEDNTQPSDKNPSAVSSSHDRSDFDRQEMSCELLGDTAVEIPGVNEIDGKDAINDSPENSIEHAEEPSKQLTRTNPKQGLKRKTVPKAENQQGRKLSKYNRKIKGKG